MANRSIWKYKLEVADSQVISLPKESKILSLLTQYDHPVIYVEVNKDEKETEDYSFECYGTGHIIRHDDSYTYLGSITMLNDSFVYHVFYKKL